MSQPQPSSPDAETVPLRASKVDTLELPMIPDPPQAPQVPPAAPHPPQASRLRPPTRSAPRRGIGRLAAAVAVLLVAALVAGGFAVARQAGSTRTGATRVLATPAIRSVDPAGGSGFRETGPGVWTTQHYRTARFGNLKPGVGLVLDLGRPERLASVSVDVVSPGVTLQLLAADHRSTPPSGWTVAATRADATGRVTLPAEPAGSFRYWLLWVPRLAPDNGGFVAALRDITLRG